MKSVQSARKELKGYFGMFLAITMVVVSFSPLAGEFASAHNVGPTLSFSGVAISSSSVKLSWTSTSATTGPGSSSLDQHDLWIWYCSGASCTPDTSGTAIFEQINNFTPIYSGTFTHSGLSSGTYKYTIREKHGGTVSEILEETITVIVSPQCSDGLDNDTDSLVDYPSDPGCIDANDDSEFNAVNTAPILGAIGNQTINENSLLQFTVSATDDGLPSGTLTFSASNLPSGATFNPTTRTFSWTPSYTDAGSYSNVHFEVTDGALTDSEDITITVNNVNRAPVLNVIGNQAGTEDAILQFTVSGTDPDGDSLIYSATNLPLGAIFDTVTQLFSWTPSFSQAGNYSVTFEVSDGALNDSEIVPIDIGDVNRTPTLSTIGDKVVDEQTALTFTASGSDADSDTLSFSLSGAPAGASIDSSTGAFSWIPDEVQGPGTYTFDVVVSDGTATDAETITVTVNEVNVAPIAADDASITDEDNAVVITAASILINDTDSDIPANTLTVTAVGNPVNGTVFLSGTDITFTPNTDFNGTATFDYSVSDGSLTDIGTVTVTVNAVAEPACSDDSDNDEDGTVDEADAGCHTDGNPNNSSSYNQNDNNEGDSADTTPPVSTFDSNHSHDVLTSETSSLSLPGSTTDDLSGVAQASSTLYKIADASVVEGSDFTNVFAEMSCGGVEASTTVETVALTLSGSDPLNKTWSYNAPISGKGVYCALVHAIDNAGNFEHTAVAGPFAYNPTTTPPPPPPPPPAGGGNGPIFTGSFGGGAVLGASTGPGQVLGVSTEECSTYLTSFIRFGANNDTDQVMRLERFLRDLAGFSNIMETGVYNQADLDAVHAFQKQYAERILTPWGATRSTGFVYLTTRKTINEIVCKFAKDFPLTADQQAEIDRVRALGEAFDANLPAPAEGSTPAPKGESVPSTKGTPEVGLKVSSTTQTAGAANASSTGGFWHGVGNFFRSIF